jgi:hypothetical protein
MAQKVVASGALLVKLGAGPPEEAARGLELGRHVGEPELRGLELRDRLAEGTARLHVVQRDVERRLRAAQRAGGDVQPPAVEAGHGVAEALAFLAQQRLGGNAGGFEQDLPGGLGVPAHLALVGAEAEAHRLLRDQERRNAVRARTAGADHGQVEVRGAGAADELLGAVQHIALVVAARPRRQRDGIAARAGLGEAVGGDLLHGQQLREPFALGLATPAVDHPGDHVVNGEKGADGRASRRQRLEDDGGVEAGETGTSAFLADVKPGHPKGRRLPEDIQRKMAVAVPGDRVGRDALAGEILRRFAQGLGVGRQVEHAGDVTPPPRPSPASTTGRGWRRCCGP